MSYENKVSNVEKKTQYIVNNILLSKNRNDEAENVGQSKTPYKAFYCPQNFEPVWKKFVEIANREYGRGGVSRLLRELILNHVARHYPGNPQPPLERFLEKPEKTEKCKFCSRPATTIATHTSGRKYPVCQKHAEKLKAHPKWKVET